MIRLLYLGILFGSTMALAQAAPSSLDSPKPAGIEGLSPDTELRGKTTLVRGVLKKLDPIHDQLLVRAFGGSDLRIAFDTRTEFFHDNTREQLRNISAGSTVSVDTVIDSGKLFARTVRLSAVAPGDLSGQVVRYDAAKSRLVIRDPRGPESIAVRVTSTTAVTNHGQPASPQSISPGALVHVQFDPGQSVATHIEILAERGNAFSFAGRIVSVDLRTRQLALSNSSDQSVRELAIGSLDPTILRLLREGADVSIQAEFDGERYNARTVTLLPQKSE